jgi:hypothetical protein
MGAPLIQRQRISTTSAARNRRYRSGPAYPFTPSLSDTETPFWGGKYIGSFNILARGARYSTILVPSIRISTLPRSKAPVDPSCRRHSGSHWEQARFKIHAINPARQLLRHPKQLILAATPIPRVRGRALTNRKIASGGDTHTLPVYFLRHRPQAHIATLRLC